MTKQVQLRRGTTAEHAVFTGAVGELTIDTSKDVAVVHDGVTVGGHELVGVAATGQTIVNKDGIGIGTTAATSALTVVGDTKVSGVSTVGNLLRVGSSNTTTTLALDVVGNSYVSGGSTIAGDVSIGGTLTIGNNTIIIDGDNNLLKGPSNILDFSYSGVSTFNNINVTGFGETTSDAVYTISKQVSVGSSIIGLTSTSGIEVGDIISITGILTDVKITGISTATTSSYNAVRRITSVSKVVSAGSTIVGLGTTSNVSVGSSLSISGYYNNVPIVGLTSVALDSIDITVRTTSISVAVSTGSTIIGVASTDGVSIGSSITILGSGQALDYSNDPNNPTQVTYTGSNLNFQNTVGAGDTDYVKFTVGITSITGLYLTNYAGTDPIAFFAIQQGSSYTAGINTTQMLAYGHFGPGAGSGNGIGANLLGGAFSGGVPITLGAGTTYTMWINQTNAGSITDYVISTNAGYSGTSIFVFNKVPVVGFTTVSKEGVNVSVLNTFISTDVSIGSTVIAIGSSTNVSVGGSISVNGYINFARIVAIATTSIGIGTLASTTPAVQISSSSTIASSIPVGTGVTLYSYSDVGPAVLIGAAFTHGSTIIAGTAVTFSDVTPQFSPAVLIGTANTVGSAITVGTAATITEVSSVLDVITVGLSNTVPSVVSSGSTARIRRISPPKGSMKVNNLHAVGITTIEQLVLSGLNFPTVDGKKGQVLVTDGQGNIGFSTGGGSGGSQSIIRVSNVSGNDDNDGSILPVKTIKKAAQLASKVGEPTTILVETGEYIEDNPIIIYDEVSVIGDSLRNIVVRPLNAGKDLFKLRSGCYLTGMTFNDYIDPTTGVPQYTYNYSVAFDDPYDTTLNRAGYAGTSIVTITNAEYTPSTGITTITTATPHEFYKRNSVRLAGIAWTCGYDETGISTFVYNHITGISTITLFSTPGNLSITDELFLFNLPFSCAAQHAGVTTTIFPYVGLGTYGAVYPIIGINTAAKTITIQGGISTIPHTYVGYSTVAVSTATYNNVVGIITVTTTSPHGLVANDNITLSGLAFTCNSGAGSSLFPSGNGPYGYTFKVSSATTSTFTAQVGVSTIVHYYNNGGFVKKVPTIQKVLRYPELNPDGRIDFGVVSVGSSTEFTARCSTASTFPHYYTQGGTARLSKPIINKSPYIQNCSILSFLGGNGILVDGNKVASPNVSIIAEEGERPPAGDQPEFGKSMVAATFTMVSFGGVGWRTINDGYAQVVSCFQIFCRFASLCQSGGYLSITNSATNFGNYALRSTGFSPRSFVFDRGRIAATGTRDGLQTLKVVGLGRSDQDLYVLQFFDNNLVNRTGNFKPVVTSQEFNGGQISTSTNIFSIPGHPFSNLDSVVYLGNEDDLNPQVISGMVPGTQYYVGYIDASSFRLYEDDGLETLVTIGSTFVGINTLTKNNQEFFVSEVFDTHSSYQKVSLASTSSTLKFVSGRQLTQTVTGGTATGIALTFNGTSRELIVSVESVAGVRRFFSTTGGNISDHNTVPVSIGVTAVAGITTYKTIEFKLDSTVPGTVISGVSTLPENYYLHFHRPSIVNSSGHTWEYSGSGTDYNALPENGGKGDPATEQVSELGGRVYASGTNELGDFKIGSQITAFNRTGNIVFNNKVSIGQLDSIRLSLSGGVAIEEFSTDVNLGEGEIGGPLNKRVSTQLAVRSFLGNRLGTFIDKTVSANAVPNAVVQLNSNGQINPDLIPPKVVNYNITQVGGGRTVLVNLIPAVNMLQGDTVVEPDDSYVLVNDVLSQYLVLDGDNTDYAFSNGSEVTSALAEAVTGVVTAPPRGLPVGFGTTGYVDYNYVGYGTTGLVKGVLLGGTITNAGSGYNVAGVYTGVNLTTVSGVGTQAVATITVGAGGSVTAIDILGGGRYFASGNIVSAAATNLGGRTGGADFQFTINDVETRLYIKLTNNQKFAGSSALADYIADANAVSISTSLTTRYEVSFTPTDISIGGNIDFANDRIVVGAGNSFVNGDPIVYDANGGNLITVGGLGIINLATYWVKVVGAGTSVELHRSYQLNDLLDLTGSGTGTHKLARAVVNVEEDTIVLVGHGYSTGTPVRVTGSTPVGIDTHAFYYTGSVTTNSFTFHETQSDALSSVNGVSFNVIGIGSTSSGTMTLTKQNVRYASVVNTSSTNPSNWSLLARDSIDASNIVSGVISPTRLGTGSANSDTVLTGTSEYKKNVFSVGIGTTQPLGVSSFTSADLAAGGVGVNTYYGAINLTVNRAAGTVDTYSTLGVARFKTSTFSVDTDGNVQIKNSTTGDVDAATLGGNAGAFYLSAANHTGSVPITRGGTGLTGVPAAGAILIGNGSAYSLTASPSFSGNVTIPRLFIDRVNNTSHGISWYSSSYTAWAEYMATAGATNVGPTANLTAPSGTIVTSWALRSFIENISGYGWTWESGTSTGQPTVVAEIRSVDGSFRTAGGIRAAGIITATGGLVVGITTFPIPTSANIGATLRYDDRGMYWDTEQGDGYTGGTVVRGYTMGGYKDAAGFNNVNRTDHASQTTYNLGDQVTTIDAYTAASSNGTFAYVFNPGGNWSAQGREINRFNMLTDSNADIATQMLTTKDRSSVMRYKFIYAYIFGDNQPEKFIHATETPVLFLTSADQNGSNGNNPACGQGELRGWHNVSGSRANYLTFATETWTSWGSVPAGDGSNKAISSYTGYMYWNTAGGYTTSAVMSKREDYTGTQILTIGKPGATGEESFHTGELAGYMVGMYNGAQNNQGGLINYTNNAFTFVSSLNSQGTPGRASAAGIEYGRGV